MSQNNGFGDEYVEIFKVQKVSCSGLLEGM
jgi:hypothetical protein